MKSIKCLLGWHHFIAKKTGAMFFVECDRCGSMEVSSFDFDEIMCKSGILPPVDPDLISWEQKGFTCPQEGKR